MRVFIYVMSCERHREFHQQARETWLKDCPVDYKFFMGGPLRPIAPDEFIGDVPDATRNAAQKTYRAAEYALKNGYDYMFKCDIDTYVHVPRLLKSGFENADWTANNNSYGGSGYWVSRRAMEQLDPMPVWGGEDHWLTKTLRDKGLVPVQDHRYNSNTDEGPRPDNDIITVHPYGTDAKQIRAAQRLARIRAYHEPWQKH